VAGFGRLLAGSWQVFWQVLAANWQVFVAFPVFFAEFAPAQFLSPSVVSAIRRTTRGHEPTPPRPRRDATELPRRLPSRECGAPGLHNVKDRPRYKRLEPRDAAKETHLHIAIFWRASQTRRDRCLAGAPWSTRMEALVAHPGRSIDQSLTSLRRSVDPRSGEGVSHRSPPYRLSIFRSAIDWEFSRSDTAHGVLQGGAIHGVTS
jgi:hypothetical protein